MPTNSLARVMLFAPLALLLACGAGARCAAQATAAAAPKEAPATVAGRVTNGEKGVQGVELLLIPPDPANRFKATARAATDAEGRFRLTNVPPGRYQLLPVAPAHVVSDIAGWPPGRPVTLSPGDAVEDINFTLTRGGVITGRITDAEGKPVIAEQVNVVPVEKDKPQFVMMGTPGRATDDRGVYRIYGLAAGRYRVSVGQSREGGAIRMGGPRRFYRLTYHPDATEEAQAKIVEVTEGGVAEDVDISVAKASKTFKVEGRFVSAETGRPVPDLQFGYGTVEKDAKRIGAFGFTGHRSNARGEFQAQEMAPGRYAIFAIAGDQEVDWYSDTATFEIDDADVSGIEVKIHRGASVSGVVHIEGVRDRATQARLLKEMSLVRNVEYEGGVTAPNWGRAVVGPDGSFRVGGLRPGKLRLGLGWPQVKGLTLVRVEREGVEQREGIEIAAEGAQITGVRLVLAYGSAVVRGQVNVTGGTLPPGARMSAMLRRPGATNQQPAAPPVEVDTRGRFVLEGVAAGEYELHLHLYGPNVPRRPPLKQNVSVTEGGETTVTLVLDLNAASKGDTTP